MPLQMNKHFLSMFKELHGLGNLYTSMTYCIQVCYFYKFVFAHNIVCAAQVMLLPH